jgi:hypothetical protein
MGGGFRVPGAVQEKGVQFGSVMKKSIAKWESWMWGFVYPSVG